MDIADHILKCIRKKGEYANPTDSIISSNLFDSLEFIRFLAELETMFDIEYDLSSAEIRTFTTAKGLVEITTCLINNKRDNGRLKERESSHSL